MRAMAEKNKSELRCDVAVLVDVETGTHDGARGFRPDAGSMESEVLKCLRAQHRRVEIVPFDIGMENTIRFDARLGRKRSDLLSVVQKPREPLLWIANLQ